jgi:diacylglycerol kinase family enzyme
VPGIGVIVNPHARGNRRDVMARAERFEHLVGPLGLVRVTETLDELREAVHVFRERDIDMLAVCGGDGSDHCTLTALQREYGERPLPLLLPLRAGTINYIVNDTGGLRGSPEQVLGRVVRDYRWGHAHLTTERDVLRVNGTELGFVLSFGTAVNFLRAYYAREVKGPLRAAWLLGRMIGSAVFGTRIARATVQAVQADIECDGEPLPFRQFTFFFAATVNQIALGFRPTYLGTRKRGYFHVVGGPIPPRRLIRRALRVHRGLPTGEPMLYDNLGKHLAIHFEQPVHYMLDGDILGPIDRLEVDVPYRVRIVRG